MFRLIWSQLRNRLGRTIALLLGIFVAASAFTVLTGATQTSRLEVVGTVAANYRPAYDILVRPKGSRTALERSDGLVRPNYLSGIYGGITMADYAKIKKVPGVDIAAPIAMIGQVIQTVTVPVDITSSLTPAQRQLFKVTTSSTTDGGLTRFTDSATGYTYVTREPLTSTPAVDPDVPYGPTETGPSGKPVLLCRQTLAGTPASSPFDPSARGQDLCYSTENGNAGNGGAPLGPGHVAMLVDIPFTFLIAAIDPRPEARLAKVGQAIVAGRYLSESDAPTLSGSEPGATLDVPVIIANAPQVDDKKRITVQRLASSAVQALAGGLPTAEADAVVRRSSGPVVSSTPVDATTAYQQLLDDISTPGQGPLIDAYWSTGPTTYTQIGARQLRPQPVTNPNSVWTSALQSAGYVQAPIDAQDVDFRQIIPHLGTNMSSSGALRLPRLQSVGQFDTAKLPGYSALSKVPLETYSPPSAAPADAKSRALLRGQELRPNSNFAGYLESSPLILTTLSSVSAFADPHVFSDTHPQDPISVVRVRVADVHGPDPVSRERIRQVAQQIQQQTGLDVDITVGSSPTAVTVDLPAGKYGRPPLSLREGWVKKGVSVAILKAADRKSLLLFVLILVVCALFVANAAAAAVRARRSELGILSCLGYSRRQLFVASIGEVATVGLAAGLGAAVLSVPLAALVGSQVSVGRAMIAAPAAVVLAGLAGLLPAMRAARAAPMDAVRPAVLNPRRARHPRSIAGLAAANLLRVPGRTALAAASLAVGVAALTLLLTVTLAFRGVLVGSLLGAAVSVQIRTVDYVAVITMIVLGAASVADVVYLGLRERAPEIAALSASGWTDSNLAALVTAEGVGIGLLGGLAGAGAGLAGVAAFAGHTTTPAVLIAVVSAVVGTAVAAVSALPPAAMLSRLPTAQLLAEE